MRLLPRRRRAAILVRISTANGVVLETDSETLRYAAVYSVGVDQWCKPGCPSDPALCLDHGWFSLVAGSTSADLGQLSPAGEFSTVPLKIEVKPVYLTGPR